MRRWLLIALLALAGCNRAPAGPSGHDTALTLFGEHRHALPRTAATIPFPMEAKYWPYALDLDYPTREALITELRTESDPLVRATHLLTLGAEAEAREAGIADWLAGKSNPEVMPDHRTMAAYLLARFPAGDPKALADYIAATGAFAQIAPSFNLADTSAGFQEFVKAQNDFLRLSVLAEVIGARELKEFRAQMRAIASDPANDVAFRLQAAQALYRLGDENIRDTLLFLGFGDAGRTQRYGWATYAFLSGEKDEPTYTTLKRALGRTTGDERGAYLAQVAHYGKPEDAAMVLEFVRAEIPTAPESRIGPAGGPAPAQTSQSEDPGKLRLYLAQDSGHPAIPEEEVPVEFEEADIELAQRVRLLRAFEAEVIRPTLIEALLKGGPATRIAAAELLIGAGDAESMAMIQLAWADPGQPPVVVAELAHCYLMIDKRLAPQTD